MNVGKIFFFYYILSPTLLPIFHAFAREMVNLLVVRNRN